MVMPQRVTIHFLLYVSLYTIIFSMQALFRLKYKLSSSILTKTKNAVIFDCVFKCNYLLPSALDLYTPSAVLIINSSPSLIKSGT